MAWGDPEESDVQQDLPAPAGAGRILGLRPAEWLATIGGLLSGVRVGSPQQIQAGGGIRPGLAMFPLANAMNTRDQEAKSAEIIKSLVSQYGNQDIPEFKPAISMIQQGDHSGGMRLLAKGINDRNLQEKENRRVAREGAASTSAAEALAPRTAPGITGFDQPGQSFINPLAPPTPSPAANWQDVERAPSSTEILATIKGMDPDLRDLASKTLLPILSEQYKETAKLSRPKMSVHGGNIVTEDQLRGTGRTTGMLQPTASDVALEARRRAQIPETQALTRWHNAQAARAEKDQGPPGSAGNPIVHEGVYEDPADGVRKRMQSQTWFVANPNAPDGWERKNRLVPLGRSPFRPPTPPSDRNIDMTTTTTAENETPAKPVTQHILENLDAGAMDYAKRVLGRPFTPATKPFTLADGRVMSPDEINQRMLDRLTKAYKEQNLNVRLRLLPGGTISVVSASEGGQKLSRTTTTARTRGVRPPPAVPMPPEDDSGDEE